LCSEYSSSTAVLAQAASPEVEVAVLQRLRNLIDQQRDQIRTRDRELSSKSTEIDNVSKMLLSHYSMTIGCECNRVLENERIVRKQSLFI
jgi:hypothetical protein